MENSRHHGLRSLIHSSAFILRSISCVTCLLIRTPGLRFQSTIYNLQSTPYLGQRLVTSPTSLRLSCKGTPRFDPFLVVPRSLQTLPPPSITGRPPLYPNAITTIAFPFDGTPYLRILVDEDKRVGHISIPQMHHTQPHPGSALRLDSSKNAAHLQANRRTALYPVHQHIGHERQYAPTWRVFVKATVPPPSPRLRT